MNAMQHVIQYIYSGKVWFTCIREIQNSDFGRYQSVIEIKM